MTRSTTALVPHQELQAASEEDPAAPLVTFLDDRMYTRSQLLDASREVCGALQARGISRGDRVVILMGNRVEFLTTWFGIAMAGGVAVPLNTAMMGSVLEHMLSLTEPRFLLSESEFVPQVVNALGDSEYLEHFICLGPTTVTRTENFQDFLGGAVAGTVVTADPWDLANILFTSGTTGPSKGVMWSHGTGRAMAEGALHVMDYTASDVVFTCLPLFHSNGLFTSFLAGLMRRATVVVAPRFSASKFWQQITESGATTVNMLGSMAPLLWQQETSAWEDSHRLRRALVIPPPLEHFAEFEARFKVQCTELYGLTDAGIPVGIPAGLSKPGSCGKELPGWQCDLVNEWDQPVAANEPGELVLRPTEPFSGQLGYYRMPEETIGAWRNLWFHTGDLMRRDDDGWFYFLDRSKDSIRRSGENISSFEVEQAILAHDDVADTAVYAVPAEFGEDEVMAAVVLKGGSTTSATEIIEWCRVRLPYFAVPRYVDLRQSIPRTATAKIQKHLLRAAGITDTTYDEGPSGRRAREQRAAHPSR